jgi:hypothetical protein
MQNRSSVNFEKSEWIKGPLDDKFISRGKFLLAYETLKKDITELEQKYRPIIYDKKIDSYYAEDFSPEGGKYEELTNDVKTVRQKYNLSPSFDRNIFYYIIHGDPLFWSKAESGGTPFRDHWFPYRFNTGEEIMVVPIYPETAIRDIQKFWPLVIKAKHEFYGHSSERVIPRKNLDRDIEVFKLKQGGLKSKMIVEKINSQYPKQKISYQDISRIIKRLKSMP